MIANILSVLMTLSNGDGAGTQTAIRTDHGDTKQLQSCHTLSA